ncbi:MAG TPA: hypothetical protein VK789_13830 [Bryobacteraceae bacterium]|nr:hypothetical protein [Bryobacteraceae bacterium]
MKTAKCRPMRWVALFCFPAFAWAQAFTFEIGSPVASQDFATKSAAFVFRTAGCAAPEKPEVSATAEGLVEGTRRTLPLKVNPSSKPGVYAVFQQWTGGRWMVVLKGSCGSAQAGAIVPVGPRGFVREDSKFFTHPATAAEIDAALKAFPEGGYK